MGKIAVKGRQVRLTGGPCCTARHNEPRQTPTTSLPVTNHLHSEKL